MSIASQTIEDTVAANIPTPDILFDIVSTDLVNDSIVVRPYSTKYINPLSSYPTYNIGISLLDPSKDLNIQIAQLCTSIVSTTLLKESPDFNIITSYLNTNANTTIFVSSSAIYPDSPTVNNTSESAHNINFVA